MTVFGLVTSMVMLGCVVLVVRELAVIDGEWKRQPFYLKTILVFLLPTIAWFAIFFFLEFLNDLRRGRW